MKKILLCLALTGCAASLYNYKSRVKAVVVNENVVEMPEDPSFGMESGPEYNYWNSTVEKVVEVSNGNDVAISGTLYCAHTLLYSETKMTVPPHKTRAIIMDFSVMYAFDKNCAFVLDK